MPPELTNEDIDILLKGLDAIATAEHLESMVASIIGGMAIGDGKQAAAQMEQDRREYLSKEGERRMRAERHMLLKARLIGMRPPVFVPEKVD